MIQYYPSFGVDMITAAEEKKEAHMPHGDGFDREANRRS
jgi:hypothetical protein